MAFYLMQLFHGQVPRSRSILKARKNAIKSPEALQRPSANGVFALIQVWAAFICPPLVANDRLLFNTMAEDGNSYVRPSLLARRLDGRILACLTYDGSSQAWSG
jgi:hypothetical protein